VGLLPTISLMVTKEGLGVTMRGLLPRVLFLGPLSAIMLSVYEWFSNMLLRRRIRLANAAEVGQ
jgi:hypothetical protein